jgi:hypothetical protein
MGGQASANGSRLEIREIHNRSPSGEAMALALALFSEARLEKERRVRERVRE